MFFKIYQNKNAIKTVFRCETNEIEKEYWPYLAASEKVNWLKATRLHIAGGVPTSEKRASVADRASRTIKHCPGIHHFMNLGVIIPLWTDILVQYDSYQGEFKLSSSDRKLEYHVHAGEQFDKSPVFDAIRPYKFVANIHSPWKIVLPEGYATMLTHPTWTAPRLDYTILTGMVPNDQMHVLNILLGWNKLGVGETIIKRGTPFAQVIPLGTPRINLDVAATQGAHAMDRTMESRLRVFFRDYRDIFRRRPT